MRRERRLHFIAAVVLAIYLFAGGIADAASLLALGDSRTPQAAVREPAGLIDQGVMWLAGLWSDLKAVFAEDTTGSGPTTQEECPPNTTCGDAGPGIDPEG